MKRSILLLYAALVFIPSVSCFERGNDTEILNDPDSSIPGDTSGGSENELKASKMNIKIGEQFLTATLVENSSVDALIEILSEGPITIEMRDYGNMEKVGPIGRNLPRNDESITTEPGDIILYQGNALVIYYAPNSWNFTRLGKIDNITKQELLAIMGDGSVSVTLSLP